MSENHEKNYIREFDAHRYLHRCGRSIDAVVDQ